MWISEYWYEKLPALYFAWALLTLSLLGRERPAQMSAFLLVAAALLVRSWRRNHRSWTTQA
ncbi:hypothetical protein [Pelomonas sp. SE-A7]|uniref:hypothetical protein n=1 Tax=Pelomonas sp. SE-A7 TaxID=3054953 RepID=UPI00259D208A|nr:hypothetical protein [Pelomonas sp. SE-A7]MDM4765660.1 hypothetical protein [Pelomonas sp. SE-A7]